MSSLQAISRFQIAEKFPVGEEISYEELSTRCGLREPDLRRIIRYAIVHHRAFCEPRKGIVAHSALSKQLAENESMRTMLAVSMEDSWPAYARVGNL